MHNFNSEESYELNRGKPRTIQKFEKRPPLKGPDKAKPSIRKSSTFKDKMNVSTPVVEVIHSKNEVHYEQNLFKNESNVSADLFKNLSCTQDKYESSSGNISNGSKTNIMPANQRLSSLVNRLKQLQVASNKPQGLDSQNNLSSTNEIKNNEKFSCLNNRLSSKSTVKNVGSSHTNGSQDKNQMWSLSSTISSPDVQVISKEISCSLSLEGTLILTNTYSGSLCSTKEYSKPTLLKTLNLVNGNDSDLSKQIWSANQASLENNRLKESDKFTQPHSNSTLLHKNGLSPEFKAENSCQSSEKENNLFKASQAQQTTSSVQQKNETQFARHERNQCENNSTSILVKKSRMSMLLDRLRSEAHSEQSSPTDSSPTVPPKLSPSKASSRTSSNQSSPRTSKSPSSPSKASSSSSRSSGSRLRGLCFNCGLDDHKYFNCPQPRNLNFCRRCGWEDVNIDSCPFCTGTLVRPGSTRPVPVGGDARKKYATVNIDRIREKTKMKEECKKSRGK